MTQSIGIIGAGVAGLTAAHQLQNKGFDVTVFEKSKSPGGRMATRRVGNGRMDHGAVFFTVRTEAFQEQVNDWMKESAAYHWFGDKHPRYAGTDGMNPLMKHLAKGLTIHLDTRITNMNYEDNQMTLTDADEKQHVFDGAVVTAPLPQAMDLINGSTIPISTDQREALAKVTYEPCYVGLFELGETVPVGEHGLLDEDLPKGIMKIVANEQKGITDTPLVSVYMNGEWSKAHEKESEADILADLLNRFRKALPDQNLSIAGKQLKRWRYSQAESLYPESFSKLDHLPVYLAGDCFVPPEDEGARSRVESAFMSGRAVAKAVATD